MVSLRLSDLLARREQSVPDRIVKSGDIPHALETDTFFGVRQQNPGVDCGKTCFRGLEGGTQSQDTMIFHDKYCYLYNEPHLPAQARHIPISLPELESCSRQERLFNESPNELVNLAIVSYMWKFG